ncbi:hypothetical protein ACS0PU_002552 [Formica fusca]
MTILFNTTNMQSKADDRKTMDNNFSNTMMDYEKYYKKGGNGYYTLHFSNKKKLSVNEIKEIFSAYGRVVAVNVTEKEDGFRFINYETLDETICCIRGLANNNIVQLLPEKSKVNDLNNRSDKKNSSKWQTARTENSFQRTSGTDKQLNLNSAQNGKFSEIESLTHNIKTSNGHSRFDNVDNFSDTGSKSSTHSIKSNVNAIKYDKSDALKSNSLSSRKQNFVNNSNKIDYEKYYKIVKDGNYVIHFVNKKELSLEEIRKLFSSYGNVISVNASGNKINGLVFVKYETLEETITCLEGLQNNHVICILPQKDKIGDTMKKTDQRNSYHWQPTETQDSFQETSKQLNSNSNYDKTFSEVQEKLIHNTTFDQDRFDNTNNNTNDIDSRSSNYGYKSVTAITDSDSLISNEQRSLSRQKSSINCEVSDYDQEQQQKNKFHSFTKQDTNTYMNKDISDKIPALISDTEIKQKEFDAMSNSSSQSGNKNALSNVMIIPMQEIIVANIHANYDVHYILHLFKKYNPISATLVETILETNIRYCRVYFKTIQDAVTIEEEFDNFDLFGKNLIVLRIPQLIEEAINSCK